MSSSFHPISPQAHPLPHTNLHFPAPQVGKSQVGEEPIKWLPYLRCLVPSLLPLQPITTLLSHSIPYLARGQCNGREEEEKREDRNEVVVTFSQDICWGVMGCSHVLSHENVRVSLATAQLVPCSVICLDLWVFWKQGAGWRQSDEG